ncbi:MAG: nucleoside kinase [Limnochordaceae bacterium]|nr:nucleoside kinase [Limnochordaceae bacterium]
MDQLGTDHRFRLICPCSCGTIVLTSLCWVSALGYPKNLEGKERKGAVSLTPESPLRVHLIPAAGQPPQDVSLPAGARLVDLLPIADQLPGSRPRRSPVVCARVNYAIRSLLSTPRDGDQVELIDLESDDGIRIYTRTLILVLARAAREVLPGCSVTVEHSLGNGLYGEIHFERPLKTSDVVAIEARMREIIAADEPIIRQRVSKEEAIHRLKAQGQQDTANLLRYLPSDAVDLYTCGWFTDYAFGTVAHRTGVLQVFRLRMYVPGFILELPRATAPDFLPPYVEQGKLANIFYEAERWGRVLGVKDVATLNEAIEAGKIGDLIRVAEAFHEKKIAQIADLIAANIERIRIVLIAGPSSSGKTTFAHRLAIQLRVNGILPVPVSMDNYFVDREHTPRDEQGNYDFDSPEAVDQALFNDQLTKMIQGEEVTLPVFDFLTGKRSFTGPTVRLSPRHLVVVEGIHGLNDALTSAIPLGRKFKIYISDLTQLNLDRLNRISTTDVRIIRRIVRDNQHRGRSALETIRMWPSVRRGEERNIFPFQEATDVMFNSALVYELAVLKPYAEPLLNQVPHDQPEYSEARRLLKFLSYFLPCDDSDVPATSIIREFIGGGCFPT